MRILLATAVMAGFAASSAYAECGHNTTAQSKAPVTVAENATQSTPVETVDDTLTGSTVEAALIKKASAEPVEVR